MRDRRGTFAGCTSCGDAILGHVPGDPCPNCGEVVGGV